MTGNFPAIGSAGHTNVGDDAKYVARIFLERLDRRFAVRDADYLKAAVLEFSRQREGYESLVFRQ